MWVVPLRDWVVDFRCESVAVLLCERLVDFMRILTEAAQISFQRQLVSLEAYVCRGGKHFRAV